MLAEKHCVPCEGGVEPLNQSAIAEKLPNVPDWSQTEDGNAITAKWTFKNFIDALEFVQRIAVIAEAENHHPDITFGWGYVHVTLMTHSIGGLHDNDFIMAAKINALKD